MRCSIRHSLKPPILNFVVDEEGHLHATQHDPNVNNLTIGECGADRVKLSGVYAGKYGDAKRMVHSR